MGPASSAGSVHGVGTIVGTLFAAPIIVVLGNGLTPINVSFFRQLVVKGLGVLLVIVALIADKLRTRRVA